jgi:hypothetical protein
MAAGAGGCGGGEDEQDVTALLDRAFKRSVESADLKLDAELQIDGLQGLDRPVRIQASGPFISGDRKLPQIDVDLTIGAAEAGQTVQTGFLSTGDRAFVKFGGEFYEQPQADIARANRELAKGGGRGRGSLADLGLRPRAWIADAKAEDDEKVAGVETDHVSATLDARRVFADLNKLVSRSANAVGGATPGVPEPLTAAQLDELAAIVKSPTFDVYVSKTDGTIRRVSGNIRVVVPEKDRSRLNGISGGSLRFTVELRKVNGSQSVEVPAKVRPIADLSEQLGGARALRPQPEPQPEPGMPAPGAPAAPGSSGDTPDLGTFEQYSQCLDRARPDDTRALSRCAELLR